MAEDMRGRNQGADNNPGNFKNRDDVSEVARKGGEAAQRSGNAHEFTDSERSEGGQKGGRNSHSGGR